MPILILPRLMPADLTIEATRPHGWRNGMGEVGRILKTLVIFTRIPIRKLREVDVGLRAYSFDSDIEEVDNLECLNISSIIISRSSSTVLVVRGYVTTHYFPNPGQPLQRTMYDRRSPSIGDVTGRPWCPPHFLGNADDTLPRPAPLPPAPKLWGDFPPPVTLFPGPYSSLLPKSKPRDVIVEVTAQSTD